MSRTLSNIAEHSRTLSNLSRTPTSKLTAKCLELSRTFSNILEFAGLLDMTVILMIMIDISYGQLAAPKQRLLKVDGRALGIHQIVEIINALFCHF